ncbi:MAG: hypothetical protein WC160_00400 [Bacilli bacterium]|jgi:hypothetical protein
MKNHKVLSIISFVGLGLIGLIFLYNFIFALAADIDPVLPMEAMVVTLPLAIGLLLVPYAVKTENRQLIYIGNMISVISSLVFVYQTGRLCLAGLSGTLNVALLISMIWPLVMLATSLTMMAYYKKADFRPIHNIVLLVAFGGIALSVLITFITILVFAIVNRNGFVFGALLPTLIVYLAIAPVVFMAFALKDEARLVKLEVPEWVKPVKPAKPAPAPKAEPKEETTQAAPKDEAPVESKEETPKA